MQAKAQLAQNLIDHSRSLENQWPGINLNVNDVNSVANNNFPNQYQNYCNNMNPISPQSSLESVDLNNNNNIHDAMIMNAHREIQSAGRSSISSEDFLVQACTSRKRPNYNGDLGELQALAFRMMRS